LSIEPAKQGYSQRYCQPDHLSFSAKGEISKKVEGYAGENIKKPCQCRVRL